MTEMHKESYESEYKAGWQAYYRGDMSAASEYFQRAIGDAEDLKDSDREMEAKWRLGMVYEVLGKLDEALVLYYEALEYFKKGALPDSYNYDF